MSEKEKGGISVNTENIFPVIKKWLYSEKDIFLREIVSNAADAVTKLKRLQSLGEIAADETPFRIDVRLDKKAGTITVEDNGIGMTAEEVKKYICSIALSGAVDFIEKYESSGDDAGKSGIIGHFGLGFYSAFMVSDTVEVFTRSYTDTPAVHFTCTSDGDYEMEEGDRQGRGTEVVLHVTDDEKAYLDAGKLRGMLDKYCAFMPVEIYFDDGEEKKKDEPETPVNDTAPLWQKPAADCTDEEYKAFYQKVFHDYREPLFQIHINADYPLNFKGILYFPRRANDYEPIDGQIKLYYNQVFVADDIKEIIPDYLLMLKGVLDCPDLPLNVSRSYLQTNTYVAKVSAHIVKKVADKLCSLCKNERERYEKVWGDIKTFVEYAAMRDEKFYDKVKEALLLRLTDGRCLTVNEYLEKAKEKHENKIYYATDPALQAQYIKLYEAEGIDVVLFDSLLETQFTGVLETRREGLKCLSVDADISALKGEGETAENEALCDLFKAAAKNDKLTVKTDVFKDGNVPAVLNVSEEGRRMEDMMKMYRLSTGKDDENPFAPEATLILNAASPLIEKIGGMAETDRERAEKLAAHVYQLAVLAHRRFSAAELQAFLDDSYKLLDDLAN